jgi:hypothetical protein
MASTTSLYLPAKIHTLLENLPPQVAECRAMRVSANKDTAAVSRIVQKWRKPTNPISQGKLGSFVEPKAQREAEPEAESFSMDTGRLAADAIGKLNAFSIGTPHADAGVREIRELVIGGKAFAVLTSHSYHRLPEEQTKGEWMRKSHRRSIT